MHRIFIDVVDYCESSIVNSFHLFDEGLCSAFPSLTEEKVDSGDPDDSAADNQKKEDVLNV